MIQSWDTAIKTGDGNDFSVCITARKRGKNLYIIDVWRGRLEFPDLKRKAVELARLHGARTILIEDKASGQQLIQALRSENLAGVPNPIARNPELDKYSRAAGVSSMVEAGQVFVLAEAHWLADFRSELLAFPNCRHDDQVDALAQLLDWTRRGWMHEPTENAGPILFVEDDYGTVHCSDDEDWDAFKIDASWNVGRDTERVRISDHMSITWPVIAIAFSDSEPIHALNAKGEVSPPRSFITNMPFVKLRLPLSKRQTTRGAGVNFVIYEQCCIFA